MKLAKNGNAAGPATRPHSYVISCSARSPRGGGMTASARQRLRSHEQQVPHLPKRVAHSQSRDHELASLRWPAVRPALCSEEPQAGGGRRPQCPGNQSRLRAFSGMSPGDSPSRITRLPLALPQSFGKLRKLHVSLNPLSVTLLCLATQKTQPLVQKLWTLRLPCGRPRKTKNYSSASIPLLQFPAVPAVGRRRNHLVDATHPKHISDRSDIRCRKWSEDFTPLWAGRRRWLGGGRLR
jgi:hypothetical protein